MTTNTPLITVIKSEDSLVEFSNGLKIVGDGDVDCCAYNYLDFEQLPVGTQLKKMELIDVYKAMRIKDDGFSIKDAEGTPKWVQARSEQNGYYSNMTDVWLEQGEEKIKVARIAGDDVY